ncbi:protein ILITYHIA-like [Primulina huaijiensis]|uniref:protein ILITYHIA-like n=1 Tax=Primulina huaijiensis TaxID=1492673 RepID=UPI003CC7520E
MNGTWDWRGIRLSEALGNVYLDLTRLFISWLGGCSKRISTSTNKPVISFVDVVTSSVNSFIQWDVRFRRNFNEVEVREFTVLLRVLKAVQLEWGIEDFRIWSVVGAAEVVWDCYRYDFGTDYSGLFKALSHVNYSVRVAAAEALAAAMDENPDTIQESLSTLFSLYIRDVGIPEENIDAGWVGRQGIALALLCAADVLQTKDLPVVMTFLISRALADPNADVRGRMIDAGIMIIDKHGRESVSLLFPIFENYLNKKIISFKNFVTPKLGVLAPPFTLESGRWRATVSVLVNILY